MSYSAQMLMKHVHYWVLETCRWTKKSNFIVLHVSWVNEWKCWWDVCMIEFEQTHFKANKIVLFLVQFSRFWFGEIFSLIQFKNIVHAWVWADAGHSKTIVSNLRFIFLNFNLFQFNNLVHDWVWADASHSKNVAGCEQQLNPFFLGLLFNNHLMLLSFFKCS